MTAAKLAIGGMLVLCGLWALWVTNGEFGLVPGQTPILLGLALAALAIYRPPERSGLLVRAMLVLTVVALGLMWAFGGVVETIFRDALRVAALLESVTAALLLAYAAVELPALRRSRMGYSA